eukprot:1176929-Prorocentrum_minimum.AAC.4
MASSGGVPLSTLTTSSRYPRHTRITAGTMPLYAARHGNRIGRPHPPGGCSPTASTSRSYCFSLATVACG